MPTNHSTPEPPDAAPDAAVDAPRPDPLPDHTDATAGASQRHDEAAMREWEGLPPDAMILVPPLAAAPPVRCPDDVWAMLVVAVDIIGDTDPDRAGDVALFAGSWVPEQPPADLYDGDLVVRLTRPANPTYPLPRDHATDVEMLLAHQRHWQRVGRWCGVDDRWPQIVAPTAAAVMGLHGDATEVIARHEVTPPPPSPLLSWARGISELLHAGLVKPGDELVWDRRNVGVRHTARIRIDGTLVLADGRVYANPSGATTALGGNHQNGWNAFRLVSDGRTLGELRTELRVRRGQ